LPVFLRVDTREHGVLMKTFALRTISAVVLLAIAQSGAAQSAAQQPTLEFCRINGRDACALSAPTIDPVTEPLVVIRMTVRNAQGARFTSGTLVVEHVETGKRATLNMKPTRSALQHVETMPPEARAPRNPQEWSSSLEAVALTASFVPGEYRVVSAQVQSTGGPLTYTASPAAIARFSVAAGQANMGHGIELLDPSGNVVSTLSTKMTSGYLAVTGYPGLDNGNYRLRATFGPHSDSKNLSLNRPTREINVSVPLVEGLPSVPVRALVMNPLTSRGLDGRHAFINRSATPISLNGQTVASAQPVQLELASGNTMVDFAVDSQEEGQQDINLFNTSPDGEHLRLRVRVWDPDKAIQALADSASSAIKVEDNGVTFRLSRDYAEFCGGPVMNRSDRDPRVAASGFSCAVTINNLAGLDYDRYLSSRISGSLQSTGENVVRYRSGVMMVPPGQSRPVFYPSKAGEKSIALTGFVPDSPTLSFSPYSKYVYYNNRLSLGENATVIDTVDESATSGALAGSVTATSRFRGLRIRVTPEGEQAREFITTRNSLSAPVLAKIVNSMDGKKVKVESWYEKAPEYKSEIDVDLLGINTNIIAVIDGDLTSHTLANSVISGKIGMARGSQVIYNDSLRSWKVRLTLNDGQPVVLDVDSSGRFSYDAGRLAVGSYKVIAEPFAQTADQSQSTSGARATVAYLTVNPGGVPSGTIRIKNTNAPVPFSAIAGVGFDQAGIERHLSVAWEVSSDNGASWAPLQDDKGRPVTGMGATLPVREAGSYRLRAIATNRWSGESAIIEAADPIVGFQRGTIRLSAPSAVSIGSLIEVQADVDGIGTPVIEWTLPAGATDVSTNGNRASFRIATAQSVVVSARARAQDADPANPASWVDKAQSIRVVNPVLAGASITGPQNVEVGKTYEYQATIADVITNPNATRNYTLRGGFVLPDGSLVEGTSANITITPGMRAISYVVWVDGQPDLRKVSTYGISPWTYTWPTWGPNVRVLQEALPASIRVVLSPSVPLSSLRNEPINLTWSVPQNVSVTPMSDALGATLTLTEPGTYNNLIATISDSRGNVTNVALPPITVASPNDVSGTIEVISPYKGAMVAPGAYTVKYRITQMPPGARFQTNELYFNGEKVGEFTGTYAIVQIQEPGTHTIGVRTVTQSGFGDTQTTVTLAPPPAPTCTVARGTSSGGQSITPTCTAEVGVPASYEWTWIEAGQNKTATTRSVYFSRAVWGQIMNLKLKVTTNLGAQQTFDVDPPR